ncbi:MAG: CPBP family intramembrane glutamic endopeptidase [Myxococcota bacterium]
MRPASGPWRPAWTASWAVVWAALMAMGQLQGSPDSPLDTFGDPVRLGARWIDREREHGLAPEEAPHPDQDAAWLVAEEVAAYAEARLHPAAAREAAIRRALLMAEDGDWQGAMAVAPDDASRVLIRRLYAPGEAAPHSGPGPETADPDAVAAARADWARALAIEPRGWLSRRVGRRLAGEGSPTALEPGDPHSPGDPGAGRRTLRLLEHAPRIALALGALAWLLSRRVRDAFGRRPGRDSSTPVPPPPSLEMALGVWVRGDVCIQAAWLAASQEPWGAWVGAETGAQLSQAAYWLAALPLLWMAQRHCWRPLREAHPLSLPRNGLGAAVGLAAVALGVDVLASEAVMNAAWGWGLESHWSEGLDETLLFGGPLARLERAADYLVWTPLVEEAGFRGVLYLGLRRRLAVGPAAAVSAAAFALLHFYSLPGLLATLVSGLVWAICFERTGSLWPSIVAHCGYNALWIAGLWAALG